MGEETIEQFTGDEPQHSIAQKLKTLVHLSHPWVFIYPRSMRESLLKQVMVYKTILDFLQIVHLFLIE